MKQEFGIIRNGEHLRRGFTSRQAAEQFITTEKQELVAQGWVTAQDMRRSVYSVVEVTGKKAW